MADSSTIKATVNLPLPVVVALIHVCRQAYEECMDGLSENEILELEVSPLKAIDIILDRAASGLYAYTMPKTYRDLWSWLDHRCKVQLAHAAWCNLSRPLRMSKDITGGENAQG